MRLSLCPASSSISLIGDGLRDLLKV